MTVNIMQYSLKYINHGIQMTLQEKRNFTPTIVGLVVAGDPFNGRPSDPTTLYKSPLISIRAYLKVTSSLVEISRNKTIIL